MGLGLRWILAVAQWVAGQEGAVSHVVTPGWPVLACLSLGALLVVLWQGRPRWLGLAPVGLAFVLWTQVERPDLLIADSGALIGVLGPEGRALSKERGDSFAANSWLENDGGPVPQEVAFQRPGLQIDGRRIMAQLGDTPVLGVRGVTALEAVTECDGAALLVSDKEVSDGRPCDVVDILRLRRDGAIAGYVENGKLRLISARDVTGDRLWNDSALQRQALESGPWWAALGDQ